MYNHALKLNIPSGSSSKLPLVLITVTLAV